MPRRIARPRVRHDRCTLSVLPMSERSREPSRKVSSSSPPASRKRAQLHMDEAELREWLESLDEVAARLGHRALADLLDRLGVRAREHGAYRYPVAATPYVNTIGVEDQPPYPGDLAVER